MGSASQGGEGGIAVDRAWLGVPLRRGLGLAILMAVSGGGGGVGRCEGSGPVPGTAALAAQAVGWSQPRLVLLSAATRVGDSPPTGWSHLVIKSIPRLASGDRDSLPSSASKTATVFRTVV